ncbi:alpha/beta fold hydrolase [Blastococcus sp. SYSU D00820]
MTAPGQRPPLLLLHGVTMSAAAWADVVPHLSDDHDVHVPTAAGHRGGAALSGPASIGALTDDAERFLDARGLDTVHVAGNSMGGWMAVELARRGRARSVCALSPAGFWEPGDTDSPGRARLRRLRLVARSTAAVAPLGMRFGPVRRLAMRDVARHGDRLTPGQAVEAVRDLVGCVAALDILGTTEVVAPLDPLPCPVAIAWAEHDRILPPAVHLAAARERLPGARLSVLAGVGHVPMVDDPAACARVIRETVRSAEGNRAA